MPSPGLEREIFYLDSKAFRAQLKRAIKTRAPDETWKIMRHYAFQIVRGVIRNTHVDSGQLRAGWALAGAAIGLGAGAVPTGQGKDKRGATPLGWGKASRSALRIEIANSAPHALAHEFGSRPHKIVPRYVKWLTIPHPSGEAPEQGEHYLLVKGKRVKPLYVKEVHHPGTKAYRPLGRSIREVTNRMRKKFASDVAKGIATA